MVKLDESSLRSVIAVNLHLFCMAGVPFVHHIMTYFCTQFHAPLPPLAAHKLLSANVFVAALSGEYDTICVR